MAVARQGEPQPSLVPLGVLLTVIASAAATYFMYPGIVVLWLGTIVTGFLAKYPILTGPKDPRTNGPTVGNPGEQRKVDRYQFWSRLRTALLTPSLPWPLTFSHLAAIGAACVAVTFPTSSLHPYWAWGNAAAAYLLITQWSAVRRETAGQSPQPMPATEVKTLLKSVGKEPKATMSALLAVAFGGATAAIAWWWLVAADWYQIWPAPVFSLGIFILTLAAVGHGVLREETQRPWREMIEATQVWDGRWAPLTRIKEKPTLIAHKRLGENGEGWVDTFLAPAGQNLDNWIPMPPDVRTTLPENTLIAFVSAPEKDENGQPIVLSRSAREFTVITWRGDSLPEITDPNTDVEVLDAYLRLRVSGACINDSGAMFDLIPLGPPQPLHAEGSETAAWLVEYGVTDSRADLTPSMPHLAGVISRELPDIEIYPFDNSFALGLVTAESTTLSDEGILDRIADEQDRNLWLQRWSDMISKQAPAYFPEHNETAEVITTMSSQPVEVHKRWFVSPNGTEVDDYFTKISTERLRTALGTVPWAAMTHVVRRDGRVPGGVAIYWSDVQLPRNPAELTPGVRSQRGVRGRPSPRASVTEATKWVLTGMLNEGFIQAKLPRPEIVSVEPLTSPESQTHIWDISVRLHGGSTVADVKRAREKIRLTLGADWFRVTESRDGARIAVGASPSHPRLTWRNDTAEQIATMLDWEQAFLDSKIANGGGQVPVLSEMGTLPKNELVKRMTFRIPAGVTVGDIRAGASRLGGATNNMFLDVRQGTAANETVILAAKESPMPELAPFNWDEVQQSDAVPFGTNLEGEPVVFDPLESPHLILLGGSGTGKSASLQAILTPAIIRGWEVVILDPVKFATDFTYAFPYATMVATELAATAEAIKRVYEEVQRRAQLNAKHGTSKVADIQGPDRPRHMVVFFDEMLSAITPDPEPKRPTGNESEEELRDRAEREQANLLKRQIGSTLGRIAREARSAGVTIVAASQSLTKQETDAVPGVFDVKKQAARILLGATQWAQRAAAFKNPEAAPELGEIVPRGRGIYETSEGAMTVFQSWFDGPPSSQHLESMLDQIMAVRDPEPVSLRNEDLTPVQEEVAVFGARIEPIHSEDTDLVVDLGEIDLGELSFEDLDLDGDDEGSEVVYTPEPEVEVGQEVAFEPEADQKPEVVYTPEPEADQKPEVVYTPEPEVEPEPEVAYAPEPEVEQEPVTPPEPASQQPMFTPAQHRRKPPSIPIQF